MKDVSYFTALRHNHPRQQRSLPGGPMTGQVADEKAFLLATCPGWTQIEEETGWPKDPVYARRVFFTPIQNYWFGAEAS